MTDTPFLTLGPRWRLAYDSRQWIVQKFNGPKRGWVSVSFVASTKAILLRVLRDKGAVIDSDGQSRLDALPDSFAEWRIRQEKVLSSAKWAEGGQVPAEGEIALSHPFLPQDESKEAA